MATKLQNIISFRGTLKKAREAGARGKRGVGEMWRKKMKGIFGTDSPQKRIWISNNRKKGRKKSGEGKKLG
jgi:hypothetical protein